MTAAGNEQLVRDVFAAFEAGDYAGAVESFAPNIVWDSSAYPGGEVYRGLPGVGESMRLWRGPWTEYSAVPLDVTDVGEGRVLAVVRERARGRGSRIAVKQIVGSIWTLRDGRVTSVRLFHSPEEALASVCGDEEHAREVVERERRRRRELRRRTRFELKEAA
jgi:ketosteroid isomerase-like protein